MNHRPDSTKAKNPLTRSVVIPLAEGLEAGKEMGDALQTGVSNLAEALNGEDHEESVEGVDADGDAG